MPAERHNNGHTDADQQGPRGAPAATASHATGALAVPTTAGGTPAPGASTTPRSASLARGSADTTAQQQSGIPLLQSGGQPRGQPDNHASAQPTATTASIPHGAATTPPAPAHPGPFEPRNDARSGNHPPAATAAPPAPAPLQRPNANAASAAPAAALLGRRGDAVFPSRLPPDGVAAIRSQLRGAPAPTAATASPGSSSGMAEEGLPPHRPNAAPADGAPLGPAVAPQKRHAAANPQSAAHPVDQQTGSPDMAGAVTTSAPPAATDAQP